MRNELRTRDLILSKKIDSLIIVNHTEEESQFPMKDYVVSTFGQAYYDSLYYATIEKYYGDMPDSLIDNVLKNISE